MSGDHRALPLMWLVVALSLGAILAEARPAEACNYGWVVRRLPLGTSQNRLVFLEIDHSRNWAPAPPGWRGRGGRGPGMPSRWSGKATLRILAADGTLAPGGTALGNVTAWDHELTLGIAPVIQKALAVARKLPGWRALPPPRHHLCAGDNRCGPLRLSTGRFDRLKLVRRVPGQRPQAVMLALTPAELEVLHPTGTRRSLDDMGSGPRTLSVGHVLHYALPGRDVFAVALGTGYRWPRTARWPELGQCRQLEACVPPELLSGHQEGFDVIVAFPSPARPVAAPPRREGRAR
jgi:hypothetical protein